LYCQGAGRPDTLPGRAARGGQSLACALHDGAPLWTLNRSDFKDVPGLRLI
jgi:hypothetical protein